MLQISHDQIFIVVGLIVEPITATAKLNWSPEAYPSIRQPSVTALFSLLPL